MRIRNRTESRSAGVSPALKNVGILPALKTAGGTPALRFATRAIPWLAALGLAFAWCPWAMAEEKPSKSPAKQPKAIKATIHTGVPTDKPGSLTATITATKNDSGRKDAKAGDPTMITATITLSGDVIGQFPATLDQALTAAMDGNPKVVAAKAKLTLAESEVSNMRMEVARKVVELWAQRQAEQSNYDDLLQGKKAVPSTVSNVVLINAAAQVSHYEMELRSLIGQAPSALPRGAANAPSPFRQPPKPPQLPRGPMVEKIRKALLTPTEIDFYESPLGDIVDYLKSTREIEIQLDQHALEDQGLSSDTPITFKLKGVSLGAALQAFDDQHDNLKLVVRDYGILVTTPSRAEERGYFPVVEFARLTAEENEPLRSPNSLSPEKKPSLGNSPNNPF
jgi:hypothetical protein